MLKMAWYWLGFYQNMNAFYSKSLHFCGAEIVGLIIALCKWAGGHNASGDDLCVSCLPLAGASPFPVWHPRLIVLDWGGPLLSLRQGRRLAGGGAVHCRLSTSAPPAQLGVPPDDYLELLAIHITLSYSGTDSSLSSPLLSQLGSTICKRRGRCLNKVE